jgi:pyruvate formate lyase activating enzyme
MKRETRCTICGNKHVTISNTLGVCLSCIRNHPEHALALTRKAHQTIRKNFHLPPSPPRDPWGITCTVCANKCTIGEGNQGYCGLRQNNNGTLVQPSQGLLHIYYDPLPSNCCAAWFCPGSKETGYNLAVFPFGCSFDCMFCQNYEHKLIERADHVTTDVLVQKATSARCICYFGGTPEPQLPFLLRATKKILEQKPVRICWEWNGTGNPQLVEQAATYSHTTNGVIKFDLKAYTKTLHIALTGRPNDRTLQNFQLVAEKFPQKNLLTATTLLVPGYIDVEEIKQIARFIAAIDPDIPYSLLGFHPDYHMVDMPITTRKLAEDCYHVAKRYLNQVHIGNQHLLTPEW